MDVVFILNCVGEESEGKSPKKKTVRSRNEMVVRYRRSCIRWLLKRLGSTLRVYVACC
jgi:hypothetical protein